MNQIKMEGGKQKCLLLLIKLAKMTELRQGTLKFKAMLFDEKDLAWRGRNMVLLSSTHHLSDLGERYLISPDPGLLSCKSS